MTGQSAARGKHVGVQTGALGSRGWAAARGGRGVSGTGPPPPAHAGAGVAVLGRGCELGLGQFLTSQPLSWLWGRGFAGSDRWRLHGLGSGRVPASLDPSLCPFSFRRPGLKNGNPSAGGLLCAWVALALGSSQGEGQSPPLPCLDRPGFCAPPQANIGQVEDFEEARKKALKLGAKKVPRGGQGLGRF